MTTRKNTKNTRKPVASKAPKAPSKPRKPRTKKAILVPPTEAQGLAAEMAAELAFELAASKAPKRPSKPKAPKAPKAEAKANAALALVKPSPAAPAVAKPTKAELAMAGQINALERMIVKLTKKAELAKSKTRSPEEILSGLPQMARQDWRDEFHTASEGGFRLTVVCHTFGKDDALELQPDKPLIADCILAIPRDTDVGGDGALSRSSGLLAVHYLRAEDGRYHGAPSYVSQGELAQIWTDSD